ncbi:MAG: patatin-like phospholipase family protein [Actinomycetota bacterium]|nr:patatin-like phospholipase family protein [Actinomycetota bacterium]
MHIDEADGVFQGGGVKGIALVGALLGFAERGYARWVNVAGASAGALIASYLACGHDAYEAEHLLRSAPYSRFEDFGPGGQLLGGAWNLLRRHGLARGEYLRRWLEDQLEGHTFATVTEDGESRLKLIAADVTRHELLVLPDDLPRYRAPDGQGPIEAARFKIGDAVRMSMSLPYFFEPVELVHHESGRASTIIDGGMLSNFPVWLFDVDDRDPVRPTFGFRLTGGRELGGLERALARIGWPLKLGSDIFHTAMEAWDKRFMSQSARGRTCPVPAGDIATTDFRLTLLQQTELVEGGRRAARRFLDSFDPEEYRNTYGRRLSAAVHA